MNRKNLAAQKKKWCVSHSFSQVCENVKLMIFLTWNCWTSCAAKRVQFSLYKMFRSSVIDHNRSTVLYKQEKLCQNVILLNVQCSYIYFLWLFDVSSIDGHLSCVRISQTRCHVFHLSSWNYIISSQNKWRWYSFNSSMLNL